MKGAIPLVYAKLKREEVRFTNKVHRSVLLQPDEIFSSEELTLIRNMAVEMGADFCEFDVLRDNTSKLIYIIDVNKTPYGPPNGLPAEDAKKAVTLLTQCFVKAFRS
jgi:glutathione synthase/RimK-type ligase-like ATP-grasp enzyme